MEIRGLGVINFRTFGMPRRARRKRVELVVQLERWKHDAIMTAWVSPTNVT